MYVGITFVFEIHLIRIFYYILHGHSQERPRHVEIYKYLYNIYSIICFINRLVSTKYVKTNRVLVSAL